MPLAGLIRVLTLCDAQIVHPTVMNVSLSDLAPPRAGFFFLPQKCACRRVRRRAKASRGDGRKSAPGGNFPYDDGVSERSPAVGTNAAIAMKRASARSLDSSEMMKATAVPVWA
jgi:hypothetical protein